MCKLCNASLNTSGGGSKESWGGGVEEPPETASGVQRILRPEGRGTESTVSLAADTRVRRFGFSSGSSGGGGSSAFGGGSVGAGAGVEGSGVSCVGIVSDEIARLERRGVVDWDGARSFRGYRRE